MRVAHRLRAGPANSLHEAAVGERSKRTDAGGYEELRSDSFVGRLSCLFQGSTDTTFYILAVYFGSVNIKYTRHAVACGLLADLAGVIAAIVIAYIFFG